MVRVAIWQTRACCLPVGRAAGPPSDAGAKVLLYTSFMGLRSQSNTVTWQLPVLSPRIDTSPLAGVRKRKVFFPGVSTTTDNPAIARPS